MRDSSRLSSPFISLLVLLAASPGAHAALIVEATVLPLGPGGFRYEISIENQGPDDVILASLLGAPLADPLIDASLEAPPGYLASYDGGLGFVDFLEDTALFAACTTVSGFAFVTAAPPGPGILDAFEAFTVQGALESGSVSITVIPEARTSLLVALGIGVLLARERRREVRR